MANGWTNEIGWEDIVRYDLENRVTPWVRAPRYRHLTGPDAYERDLQATATGIDNPLLESRQIRNNIQAEFHGHEPEIVNPGFMTPGGQVPIPEDMSLALGLATGTSTQNYLTPVERGNFASTDSSGMSSAAQGAPSMWASNAQGGKQVEEEEKSGGGGPRFDPMRAQAFLDDQIANIWELVNAGIISMDEAQARYQATIDEVYGRQQKVYEDAGTDVLADIVASQEAKQSSRDEIDRMMKSVGVDPARTAADRGARDEMDKAYARGREDLMADMARNIGIGQAGRTADAQEMFEQARTELTLGGQQSEAELNQLFDIASARAATLGVDPMMVFVDMMANTNDTGRVISGRESAAAEQKQMDFYTDIAQGLVDSGGFPGGMAEALPYVMGIIDKNYFNTGGSMGFDQFVDQYPHLIGPSQDMIQQAMKQYGLDYDQAFQMVMGGLMGELMNPVNNDSSKGGMYGAAKAM